MKNCAIFIGRLGADPEFKTLASGKSLATFSVGVAVEGKKDQTFWANCKVWEKKAEVARDYLKKGSQVSVMASMETEKFTTKTGNNVEKTVFNVTSFSMLDKKSDSPKVDAFMTEPEDDVATF